MTPESINERNERIFQHLPRLGSAEYLELLKVAPADALPASVLARVYRQLGCTGAAAERTVERLLLTDRAYYFRSAKRYIRRCTAKGGWITAEDLELEAVAVIVLTLPTERGAVAERAWVTFLHQAMVDAFRNLAGRRGERREPPRPTSGTDADEEPDDPTERLDALTAPWHGRVAADNLEWLESFVRRTMACVREERIREIGLDQFCGDPSPISGAGKPGRTPLTERYAASRYQIMRWRNAALVRLLEALRRQNERDIDVSWLDDWYRRQHRG